MYSDTLVIVNILERRGTGKRERQRRKWEIFLVLLNFASQTLGDLRVDVELRSAGFLGVEIRGNILIQWVLCAEQQCVVTESIS